MEAIESKIKKIKEPRIDDPNIKYKLKSTFGRFMEGILEIVQVPNL